MLRTNKERLARIAMALTLSASLALTACSPGDGDNSDIGSVPDSVPVGAAPGGDDGMAMAKCMLGKGIDVMKPGTGSTSSGVQLPEGVTEQEMNAALEVCREFMPNGGEMPGPSAEQQEAQLEFSRCMRDEGITEFPDPTQEDGRLAIEEGGSVDPEDPAFKKAQATCEHYLPTQGPASNRAGG